MHEGFNEIWHLLRSGRFSKGKGGSLRRTRVIPQTTLEHLSISNWNRQMDEEFLWRTHLTNILTVVIHPNLLNPHCAIKYSKGILKSTIKSVEMTSGALGS